MKKLVKRINIDNATSFKLEYYDGKCMKVKEFSTYKAMEQFHGRQTDFMYLDINRYAFVNGKWNKFIKLRSPFVFQKELDFINNTFKEKIDAKKLQKSKNEEINFQNN